MLQDDNVISSTIENRFQSGGAGLRAGRVLSHPEAATVLKAVLYF